MYRIKADHLLAASGMGDEDKASHAPVGVSVKRAKRRSGKRWGADVDDAPAAPSSGVSNKEALAGLGDEAAAAGLREHHEELQPVDKSRKPKHKRWGPDKDIPDADALSQQTAEPMADSGTQAASASAQQKPKRKRWGPDALNSDPDPDFAAPAPAQAKPAPASAQAEQAPALSDEQRRRKRWGPDRQAASAKELMPQAAEQPETAVGVVITGGLELASAAADAKNSRKRRWGPEDSAPSAVAPATPAVPAASTVRSLTLQQQGSLGMYSGMRDPFT